MRILFAEVLAVAALTIGLATGVAQAHEGHDHGALPALTTSAAPRAEANSGAFELVAIARGELLTLYLDRFATNEPVKDATVQADTPAGTAAVVPTLDGAYRLEARWALKPGQHEMLFTVSADGTTDVFPVTLNIPEPAAAAPVVASWLDVPALARDLKARLTRSDPVIAGAAAGGFLLGILVMLVRRRRLIPALAMLALTATLLLGSNALAHEGEDHGDAKPAAGQPPGRDLAQRLPDGSVFVPKPTQRILAIRTVVTAPAAHQRRIELPGRIIPDPNASGYAQASTGGRLSAPPNGFPRLGTPVKKGDVLAYVTPPLQAIDVSDIRQRQGELDQQINIVERRIARF